MQDFLFFSHSAMENNYLKMYFKVLFSPCPDGGMADATDLKSVPR